MMHVSMCHLLKLTSVQYKIIPMHRTVSMKHEGVFGVSKLTRIARMAREVDRLSQNLGKIHVFPKVAQLICAYLYGHGSSIMFSP